MLSAFSETIRLNTLGIGSGKGFLADNANAHRTGAGTETGSNTYFIYPSIYIQGCNNFPLQL